MNNLTPYQILGIKNNTLLKDAQKQYYNLLKQHHPDKGGDVSTTQKINDAWEKIKEKLPKTEKEVEDFNNKNRTSFKFEGKNIIFKDQPDTQATTTIESKFVCSNCKFEQWLKHERKNKISTECPSCRSYQVFKIKNYRPY